ncbi:xylulokinase [Maudiozyma humilis]|uniref:Xylulose kinase n=1 Tax=Maudiozyma humilis TaxID=51915 RepID=A0AAV5RWJ8_MAUHU|nr:xylulokinase [Kazachstania humilis]
MQYTLGFDLSTQQLKCVAVDENLQPAGEASVDFDADLPGYKTTKGVYISGETVCSPVAQWLEAFDLVLERLAATGLDLGLVTAISGSCQQHGAVFWGEDGSTLLASLDANQGNLVDQLAPTAFSRTTAPNWQDHSTGAQCQAMEAAVGGPQGMAQVTGSRAHLRFTGPQILKVIETEPAAYEATHAITLVSNFATSLLCGKLVPLEEADACGMNLYDIERREFSRPLLQLLEDQRTAPTGPSLLSKLLGEPVRVQGPGETPVCAGNVARYFTDRYGLSPSCRVYPFTGDNLATLCSLPLHGGDAMVSMGTSTTVLLCTREYCPSPSYHLFRHPVLPDHYMAMVCYCNGSLAREQIRDELNATKSIAPGDWEEFSAAVADDSLDTSDELAVYFPLGEIVPSIQATTARVRFDRATGQLTDHVASFPDRRHDAKAIVESQALSCRVRIAPLLTPQPGAFTTTVTASSGTTVSFDGEVRPLGDLLDRRPSRCFFVGGASRNTAIVRRFAAVLGPTAGAFRSENPNACAVGGCYKALWSWLRSSDPQGPDFAQFLDSSMPAGAVASVAGREDAAWDHYNHYIVALSNLERELCA